MVALVSGFGAVCWLAQLALVGGVNRFRTVHRRYRVCRIRSLHRIFLVGYQRHVGTFLVVRDGVAIQEIDCWFWNESLACSGKGDRLRHPPRRRSHHVSIPLSELGSEDSGHNIDESLMDDRLLSVRVFEIVWPGLRVGLSLEGQPQGAFHSTLDTRPALSHWFVAASCTRTTGCFLRALDTATDQSATDQSLGISGHGIAPILDIKSVTRDDGWALRDSNPRPQPCESVLGGFRHLGISGKTQLRGHLRVPLLRADIPHFPFVRARSAHAGNSLQGAS